MLPPFPRSKKVNLGALSRIVSSEPSISSTFAAPKLEKVITLFYYANCTPTYLLHSTAFMEYSSDTTVVKVYIKRGGIMVPFNSLLVIYMPRDGYFTSKIDQKYINLNTSPASKINLGNGVGLTWKTVRPSEKFLATALEHIWRWIGFNWFFVGHR